MKSLEETNFMRAANSLPLHKVWGVSGPSFNYLPMTTFGVLSDRFGSLMLLLYFDDSLRIIVLLVVYWWASYHFNIILLSHQLVWLESTLWSDPDTNRCKAYFLVSLTLCRVMSITLPNISIVEMYPWGTTFSNTWSDAPSQPVPHLLTFMDHISYLLESFKETEKWMKTKKRRKRER